MATLRCSSRLEVHAARRLRPVTEALDLPVVDAVGRRLGKSRLLFNTAGDAIVATVTTSVRDEAGA